MKYYESVAIASRANTVGDLVTTGNKLEIDVKRSATIYDLSHSLWLQYVNKLVYIYNYILHHNLYHIVDRWLDVNIRIEGCG